MKNNDPEKCADRCDAKGKSGGPVREAGGTTGAGNLSGGQADRTGGATSGVPSKSQERPPKFQPPPSA